MRHPAAVRLCKQVVQLRALLPREHSCGGPDAVATLDASRPGWRAELPFDLDEQDVRVLVEDLVRACKRRSPGTFGVTASP